MKFVVTSPTDPAATPAWDDPSAFRTLDELVTRCDDALHDLLLWDADLIAGSGWVLGVRSTAGAKYEELLKEAQVSAYAQAPTDAFEVTTTDEAKSALRNARTPLLVLVENDLRDAAFLKAVVALLKPPFCRLLTSPPTPPAIEFRSTSGYGDMPNQVRAAATRATEHQVHLRLIVVRDADFVSAGVHQPEALKSIAKICEAVRSTPRAHFVLWTKCSAENYLPDEYWREYSAKDPRNLEHTKRIESLLSRSSAERDAVRMGDLGLKEVGDRSATGKTFHLSRFHRLVSPPAGVPPTLSESDLAAWATSLRERDHSGDLDRLLHLMETLR